MNRPVTSEQKGKVKIWIPGLKIDLVFLSLPQLQNRKKFQRLLAIVDNSQEKSWNIN